MISKKTHPLFYPLFKLLMTGALTFASASTHSQELNVTTSKNKPAIALFNPPQGWNAADQKDLSAHVKVLVIGPKLQNDMPPTMNLMIEPYEGTLKSYLKNVKKINDSHGDSWKDLGSLKTKAGEASLSQVEIRSKWGGEKLMHAIIVRNGYAYVLTATAAKNEFGRFYQTFYNALRSLQIYDNAFDMIDSAEKRSHLENAYAAIQRDFEKRIHSMGIVKDQAVSREEMFQSPEFQNNAWKPFQNMLQRDYKDLGAPWQNIVLEDLKERLLNS